MTVVEGWELISSSSNWSLFKCHLTSAMDSQTKKSHQNKPHALNTLINHQSSSKQRVHKQNPNQCKAKKKKKKTPKTKNQAPK